MSQPRKFVHVEIIPIRWGDMDAMGHVNNTVYFRYMEQARIAWYDKLGLRPGDGLPEGAGPVIVNAHCSFLKPLTYPGDVEVKVYVGEPGRASIMTYYELRPSYDPRTLYAEGSAKGCWIDTGRGKSIPLPERVRGIMAG